MATVVSLAPSMCTECLCDSMKNSVENGDTKKMLQDVLVHRK